MTAPVRFQLSRAKGWRLPENAVKVDRSSRWGNPWRAWRDPYEQRGSQWMVSAGGSHHVAEPNTKASALSTAVWLHREEINAPGPHHSRFNDPVPTRTDIIKALRGRNLACWCGLCERHKAGKPFGESCADCAPCHADTLGEIANGPICEAVP